MSDARLPTTRPRMGIVLLGFGALLAFLGMVVLSDVYGDVALVLAVGLLAAGTLLYGTTGRRTPRQPT